MDHSARARLPALALLVPVLLIGFALRVHALDGRDLWGDEAASLDIIQDGWRAVFEPARETHPPLHRALYKPWVDAVGEKPLFALRYAPMLAGVLLVPLTDDLARRLFGRGVGLLAALLIAVGPLHVYYAQEFRTYSLFTVMAVVTTSAFVALTRRGARRVWVVYLGVALAALYTHYLTFWLLLAQNAVALLSRAWSGRRRRWLGGQAALGLAYLPWALAQAPFLLGQGGRRALNSSLADAWEIARRGALSWNVGLTPGENALLAGALTVMAAALAVLGLMGAARPERWRAGLLGGCIGFTLLMTWVVNPVMPFFHERFLIGAAPMFTILVAAGVWNLSEKPLLSPRTGGLSSLSRTYRIGSWHLRARRGAARRAPATALLSLLVAGALAADHQWYTDPAYERSGYGGALRAIAAEAQPSDVILLSNALQMALFDYYRLPEIRARLTDPALLLDDAQAEAHLGALVGDAPRVWLVEYGDPIGYDRERRALAWLATHGYRQRFYSFLGGTVSLYVMGATGADWQPVDARFGDAILLTGYALAPPDPRPGDVLLIALRWETLTPISARYTVTNQLLDATGRLAAQVDGEPVGGARPTDSWAVGDVIADRHALALPADLPPGVYTLYVGLYPWPDLTRLPVGDGDLFRLATLQVADGE